MTHASEYFDQVLDWDDCEIEHYDGNNGVVLRYDTHPHNSVLFFIHGYSIGVSEDTPFEDVVERIEPLFKAFLSVRNHAYTRGVKFGDDNARYEIRKALGI